MVKPGLEGEVQGRQTSKTGPPGGIEHLAVERIGAPSGQHIAGIPGDGMANAAKATVASRNLRLQHARDPVTQSQIGVTDDAAAQPRWPILAAGTHRRRPVDKFRLADGLHFDWAVGAVHRTALDKKRSE